VTHDGNRLAPADLKLVQLAINNMLDRDGLTLFQHLYDNATKPGGYTAPYLFGIEHLTIDKQGRVFWRGLVVEYFDHAFWKRTGWRARMLADAAELATRCRQLEAAGLQPTVAKVLPSGHGRSRSS
jgi:hypothetical protein